MKAIKLLAALLVLTPAAALAADRVKWEPDRPEFKYFTERGSYDEKSWAELAPAEQEKALEDAAEPAAARQQAVAQAYRPMAARWDTAQLRYYSSGLKNSDINAVYLWVGKQEGHELAHKLFTVREAVNKASVSGLGTEDEAALGQYLTPEAIKDLHSMKFASDLARKQAAGIKDKGPASGSSSKLGKLGGASPSKLSAGKLSGLYDKADQSGSPDMGTSAAVIGAGGKPGLQSGKPNATAARTIKYSAPEALQGPAPKSKAWTSDAYGITVETAQGTQAYRKSSEAEAAIRKLPPGSVKKIILYGHGSPGMQTVGDAVYDADGTAALLKDKMAQGGVIQFAGCNTSSIGGATLNPAVGLSMVARRLLYFSLPYFQDRADGIPAAQAREQWEKGWNADLARDTSLGVKGAVVCGYRTFGLVPGRLPGLTKLLGTQEATSPGVVAGKKACYQDGKEVPAP